MDFLCGVAFGGGVVAVGSQEVMEVGQRTDDRLAAASGQLGEERSQDLFVGVAGLDLACLDGPSADITSTAALVQVQRDTKPPEAALDAMLELVARLSGGSG